MNTSAKNLIRNLSIALFGAVLVVVLAGAGALKRLDRWVQDLLFQRPGAVPADIVVIGIDEEALTRLGGYGTWDRNIMAQALEALSADPERLPAVVAIDTLYVGETEPEADAHLTEAVRSLPAVVMASSAAFGEEVRVNESGGFSLDNYVIVQYEEPFDALREVSTVGHINAMLDMDGIMRHGLLYVEPESGRRVYSLSFEAARLYLEQQGEQIRLPCTDARGDFYIPFSARPGTYYDGVSVAALIAGEVPADYYEGKIVLIGPYAAGLQDAYFTPVDRAEQMYGVEFQANVIQMFLDNNFKREASGGLQLLFLFLLCLLLFFLFQIMSIIPSSILCAASAAGTIVFPMLLYRNGLITHPLWYLFGTVFLYIVSIAIRYISAALEKQQVTRTFERYVAPQIVKEILKEGTENLSLGGRLCEIAVLFVDVRGFTTMSERMSPEEVVYILNRYLTMTSGCIEKNRGTLDKFVGDATMAFWGAPLAEPDSVYLAVKTAQDIVDGAERLSEDLKEEIGEELRVGVGVHFGPAVVGNMGSERRMDFTAIGDTVNTAARLEANAPGGKVYISRAVADALSGRIKAVSLGDTVRLKGKKEGFEVLELREIITL